MERNKMDLEDILRSKIRRRIIKVLWKIGSTNLMDLIRRTNSTYNQLVPHLQILKQEGIVKDQRLTRARIITLERENQKTILLLQALKILDPSYLAPNKSASDTKQAKQQDSNVESVKPESDAASNLSQDKLRSTKL